MPRLLVAVTLLLSLAALAQPAPRADLAVEGFVIDRVAAGDTWIGSATIRNHGPDAAYNVVLTTSAGRLEGIRSGCLASNPSRCVIEVLPPNGERSFTIRFDRDLTPKTVPVELTLTSDTPDPNASNNRFAGRVEVAYSPRLRFNLYTAVVADPGGTAEYDLSITNDSEVPARNARFTLPLPDGWSFERATEGLHCALSDRNLTCTVASIAPHTTFRGDLVLRAPNLIDGSPYHSAPIELTTDDGVFLDPNWGPGNFVTTIYRHLTVTHTGDEGEGSLRHAINMANAECGGHPSPPCKIVFDITGATAVQTIRPETPLPTISTGMAIDGATQTARHGDTNPLGPEIEINGSLLHAGDAFDVNGEGWGFQLSDVVVNGFPGNAVTIRATGWSRLILRSYIGTDATGQTAVPNTRGIVIDIPGQYYTASTLIRDNVISGNTRSGVFINSGFEMSIAGNRIGTTAGQVPRPLGNGASGIYIGPRASAISITKNVIAYNTEAGIATSPASGFVAIRGNSIAHNGGLGIDLGLDGTAAPAAPRPVITSAQYDAATGITRIEGKVGAGAPSSPSEVELFANTAGEDEGELFLGTARATATGFVLEYRGDLRGRVITGTYTFPNNYYPEAPYFVTTELGPGFRIEGDAAPIDPAVTVPRGADLSVRLSSLYQVLAGLDSLIWVQLGNLGPDPAGSAIVEITAEAGRLDPRGLPCTVSADGRTLRCELDDLKPVYISLQAPRDVHSFNIRARITSAVPDPDLGNNESTLNVIVSSKPAFDVSIDSPGPVEPGALATYSVNVSQMTAVDARNAEIRIPLMNGWSLASSGSSGWTCAAEGQSIVCRTPLVEANSSRSFSFSLRAPNYQEGLQKNAVIASMTSADGIHIGISAWLVYEVYRMLHVTSDADSGPGSLRDLLHHANGQCNGAINCKLVFASGIQSITPLSELPWINADNVTIAANGIEINGSQLAAGDGLTVASTGDFVLRGFTISGFPGNGLVVRTHNTNNYASRRTILDNRIVGNGGRGMMVIAEGNAPANLDVLGNVISGNARAGVFVASGERIRIAGNRIGVAADGTAMPNGASGVYAATGTAVQVEGNVIAFNAHAGVAADREAMWTGLRGNSIYANGGLGFDHGLDNVTFNDDAGRSEELPRFPLILSAVWDESAKVTRIEGRSEATRNYLSLIELFANDAPDGSGYGEAQRPLGEVVLNPGQGERAFTFTIAEDLRGKSITATLSRHNGFLQSWTSEISAAVPVQ